ncbi:hypothetical protein NLG97_g6023 [Lecanicillium saksenae]|uniref:Uncharacterized protein n=1 Tax=Lecanicillium saksenae TaxID=468837 RepID=A0ACC1QT68_9HYPO|nr:hypothetical protein NLG97_g6023 [Lecanicillium saksenae]
MELYAAGCNAFGQLNFGPSGPSDVPKFTKIASGTTIEKPVSRLVYTLIKIDGEYLKAGHPPDKSLVVNAYSMAVRANEDSLRADTRRQAASVLKKGGQSETHQVDGIIAQIAAFDTGFIILYENGRIATMGDPRFPAPLGRMPTKQQPAEKFEMLPEFAPEDPVKHITACGYAAAALTELGSVYIWGRNLPSRPTEHFFPGLSTWANYVSIADSKEIEDFALGETHAIALTCDGEIYVIGNNENGQLGMPGSEVLHTWTKVEFSPPDDYLITGVAAGPHTSFIIVSERNRYD